jgi:hypothetical protein
MQTGFHTVSWTLQRLAIGLAMLAGLVFFASFMVVAVVVVGQAVTAFGH